MVEIDKRYEKVKNETTKSYEQKREKLKKEEEDLKEKLKIEVTKAKEQLEIYLSEVNNLLIKNEKLVKRMKTLEKEEKIMIKTLSYISKINKNENEMIKIFQELMKNIKINFIEEESTIKYEEYYFNGIPIPKYIEFKEMDYNKLIIEWKIDYTNLLNINKSNIKYKVELKKENSKEEFIQIYKGYNNYYSVNYYDKYANYIIRICSVYNNLISDWIIFHIKNLDSIILGEIEKGNEFIEKLYEWTEYTKMELLYRGTRDGSGSNIFHNKCDNQGPTICLCKNEKGNIFGGYASISWTSDNNYHSANGSFLFTLTNNNGTDPTKYPNKQYHNYAVYHGSDYGPTFGGNFDLHISNDYMNNTDSYCSLGYSYPDTLGQGNSIFSGSVNNNHFKLKELEVFKLFN